MKYLVQWEIDIFAETPEDAARQAFDIMQKQGTTATVFDVTPEDGETSRVDLQELDAGDDWLAPCPRCEGAGGFGDNGVCGDCEGSGTNADPQHPDTKRTY